MNSRENDSAWWAGLLLLGAFAFAIGIVQSVHELGHALALRAYGISDVRIVLHPFLGSRTIWQDTTDYAGFGTVDAAGPLAPITLGAIVTLALWRWRRAILLPLLLILPLGAVSEGFSNLMQLAFQSPGSDALRMVEAGVPIAVFAGVALVIFAFGLASFCLLLPLLGVAPGDPFRRKFTILAGGMIPYWLVTMLVIMRFDAENTPRGVILLTFSLLIALAIAALHRPLDRWLRRWSDTAANVVDLLAVRAALGMGTATVLVLAIFFN